MNTPTKAVTGMTPEQLKLAGEVLALREKATKGPWQNSGYDLCRDLEYKNGRTSAYWIGEIDHLNRDDFNNDEGTSEDADADLAFILAAHTACDLLAALLKEREALVRDAARWRASQEHWARLQGAGSARRREENIDDMLKDASLAAGADKQEGVE